MRLTRRSSDPMNCDHPVLESSACGSSSVAFLSWRCTDCKTGLTLQGQPAPPPAQEETKP